MRLVGQTTERYLKANRRDERQRCPSGSHQPTKEAIVLRWESTQGETPLSPSCA